MNIRSLGVVALPISFFFLQPSARAEDRNVKERAAKKACMTGNVAKGVELLAELYLDISDATYIFNQGRCYEQNSRFEEAIGRFREYLRKAKNDTEANRADAEKHLADCQALLREKSQVVAPAIVNFAPTPPPAPGIPSAVAPTPGPPAIIQFAPTPEPLSAPPVYRRWWFWSGIGAVVAGGVVTAIVLSSKSAPISPACDTGTGVICVRP